MDSVQRINVLESYDLKFCCVCVQNGDQSYLNVFENVIQYQNVYISLAQIINETLSPLNVQRNSAHPQEICGNCKTKIVDFFIFKRRNEETRRIYERSASPKNILLQVVEHLENMPQDDENVVKEETFEEELYETQEEVMDQDFLQEEVYDATEVDVNESLDEHLTVMTEELPEKPPPKTRSKAVRRSNPDSWKRNTRKLAKNAGQSYVASNGKFVEAKRMKDNCGTSCRMQCVKKVTESSRIDNFKTFYSLADIAKQRKFLFDHMKTFEPRRIKNLPATKKCRNVQRNYFLDVTHPNGAEERVQVCKLLFLNTFCISSQMIDTLYRKALTEGRFSDIRGKFERRSTKTRTEEADFTQQEDTS